MSDAVHTVRAIELRAFTRGAAPTLRFPLLLNAVTVAVVALWLDDVPAFSQDAYFLGLLLAAGFALVAGSILARTRGRARTRAAVLLPLAFGGVIGMAVQAVVLGAPRVGVVRDLGGLVRTTEAPEWILAGLILGGVPALVLAAFLLGARRVVQRFAGLDAGEATDVALGGSAGIAAGIALLVVDAPIVRGPLLVVVASAALSVILAILVDRARIRFLRAAYAGADGFDVVPAERFGADPGLTALVAGAGSDAVLVRRAASALYRDVGSVPLGLLAGTETATLAPLRRRQRVALACLGTLVVLVIAAFAWPTP